MLPLRSAIALILAAGSTSALAEQITCESRSRGAEPCGTVAAGSTVRLARQLGGSCVEGRTWGTGPSHDSIWVSDGCRAVFEVQPPYSSTSTRPADQLDDADGELDRDNSEDESTGARNAYHTDERDDRYSEAPVPRDDASRDDNPRAEDRHAMEREDDPDDRDDDARRDNRSDYSESRRYARAERHDGAAQACISAAAVGQRFGPDRIEAGEARQIGRGLYSVDLDTPIGPVECTVDRDGLVHTLDRER